MTEKEALILLNSLKDFGFIRMKSLLKLYKTPQQILEKGTLAGLQRVEGIGKVVASSIVEIAKDGKEKLSRELDLVRKNEIKVISIFDKEYPSLLKATYNPPILLYVKGEILPEDTISLGIVGSRLSSYYGLETATRLASCLSRQGITIVSGMARGIDTASHKGALQAKGRTIAVLGSGLGVIYPPENKKLFLEIAEAGAVVSEFPYETIPDRQNFPMRNRIISGLSLGIVVVEAAKYSGSLITANFALEQGREVFAVPGKVSSATSKGTNNLIKRGAKLAEDADDIIEELEPLIGRYLEAIKKDNISRETVLTGGRPGSVDRSGQRPVDLQLKPLSGAAGQDENPARTALQPRFSTEEKKVYQPLSDEPLHIDEIVEKARLPVANVSSILMKLELNQLIRQLPGKRFVKR